MQSDDEIKALMSASRIPREALRTTLPKLGFPGVRDWVTGREIVDKPICYIQAGKALDDGNLLFYTTVKEAILTYHAPAFCGDLIELHGAVVAQDDEGLAATLDRARVVAVRNFVDSGACPLTPYDVAKLSSYLYRRVQGGGILILHLAEGTAISQWWPVSFMKFVSGKSYGVVAK